LAPVGGGVVDGFVLSGVGADVVSVVGVEAAGELALMLAEHVGRVVVVLDRLAGVVDEDWILAESQEVVGELAKAVGAGPVVVEWVDSDSLRGSRARLQFHTDPADGDPSGGPQKILVARSQARDPRRLMATLVHEVVHAAQRIAVRSDEPWPLWANAVLRWRESMSEEGLRVAGQLRREYEEAAAAGSDDRAQLEAFRAYYGTVPHERDARGIEAWFAGLLDEELAGSHAVTGVASSTPDTALIPALNLDDAS
jgi:hypothetical protein